MELGTVFAGAECNFLAAVHNHRLAGFNLVAADKRSVAGPVIRNRNLIAVKCDGAMHAAHAGGIFRVNNLAAFGIASDYNRNALFEFYALARQASGGQHQRAFVLFAIAVYQIIKLTL